MPKKKEGDAEEIKKMPLEELILDKAKEKYLLVPLAAEWAKELKKSEEWRHMTQNEILDKSLEDVISGSITWEKLKKMAAANPTDGAAEEPKKSKKDEE